LLRVQMVAWLSDPMTVYEHRWDWRVVSMCRARATASGTDLFDGCGVEA